MTASHLSEMLVARETINGIGQRRKKTKKKTRNSNKSPIVA